jgi:hypothetical protein
VRTFTVAERRNRLAQRHFLTSDAECPPLAKQTAALIGWHASDPATPYLSLWARRSGFAVGDLDAALYQQRCVVKHLAMRRTLWILPAADLAAVQPGASSRVADNEQRRLVADVEKAGVADDGARWLQSAAVAVLRHLSTHGDASSAELRSALPELAGTYDPAPGKRWGGATPLAPRVLTVLAVQGKIVRGTNEGSWTTSRHRWVHTANWLGDDVAPMAAEIARAELVRRWLGAFGPATLADIRWWFGSTLTATRHALAQVQAVEVDVHGEPGWALPDDLEDAPDCAPWAALLPGLDVTTMGWAGRDWFLGPHGAAVFDSNGNAGPTAWWDGRVVGGWHHDHDGRVRLQLLEDPGRAARKALETKATELTEWLDGVRIKPRFPSRLSKVAPTE